MSKDRLICESCKTVPFISIANPTALESRQIVVACKCTRVAMPEKDGNVRIARNRWKHKGD